MINKSSICFPFSCNSEDEYACNADTKIPISKKCDGTVDCPAEWNDLGDDENYDICPPGDGRKKIMKSTFNWFFSLLAHAI